MSASPQSIRHLEASLFFERMQVSDVSEVLLIEEKVYPHPWTLANFLDSLQSDYQAWIVRDSARVLLGYFLLMLAVDEAHLLNISVRGDAQGQGLGQILLDRAMAMARGNQMSSVLLEVRPSNARALEIYLRYGFREIGRRKGYYPAADQRREDAIVMSFPL